ncbi:MAG: putative bifunctional diguanylate cyclase/phosphodiesterase [Thermoleophilaceae bacterium]
MADGENGIERLLGMGLQSVDVLLGGMSDLALVVDPDGRILYTNRDPDGGLTGTTLFDHDLGAESEARTRAALHQVFVIGKPISYEVESYDPAGEPGWYVSRWSPIRRDEKVVGALIVTADITRQLQRERGGRKDALLESAAEGILGIDADGHLTFANAAAAELLGASLADLQSRHIHDVVHAGVAGQPSHEATDCPLVASIRLEQVRQAEDDVFARAGESSFPVTYTLSPIVNRGELVGGVLTFNDGTERKRFEAQLRYLADRDPVTGLYNRRRFEQELARRVSPDASHRGGAVLALDLDNLKYVNDTFGHKAGDEMIARVARTLGDEIPEGAALARLGGDEFMILIPDAGIEQAQALARAVIDAVRRQTISAAGQQVRVTASVGVTTYGNRNVDGETLLVEADLAMYEAKAAGRDTVALYTPMAVREAQRESQLAWVERVRRALAEDRFTLYSQPVVSVESGDAVQHELLLRMVDDGEVVLPGSFLPSAERFGLMPAVDRWVVRQAVRLLAESDPTLKLEVNVSGESLEDEELTTMLAATLSERGIHPGRLIIEVTEQTAVANIDATRRFAQRVKHIGCRFALDDFGAGFGSFYYLKYLPFDYLKIDGDFIHSLPANRTDQLVVEAVTRIAHGLGTQTIAEFVGDDDTLVLLRDSGVNLAQGHFLGRPEPADRLLPGS